MHWHCTYIRPEKNAKNKIEEHAMTLCAWREGLAAMISLSTRLLLLLQGIVSWPVFVFHVILRFQRCSVLCPHCKEPMPKIRNKYFQKRNCVATVPISTFICLWAIYIFPPSICLFCCRKKCGSILGIKNQSQTHECGNWDWDRALPKKKYINGIFVAVHLCPGFLTFWDASRSDLDS